MSQQAGRDPLLGGGHTLTKIEMLVLYVSPNSISFFFVGHQLPAVENHCSKLYANDLAFVSFSLEIQITCLFKNMFDESLSSNKTCFLIDPKIFPSKLFTMTLFVLVS